MYAAAQVFYFYTETIFRVATFYIEILLFHSSTVDFVFPINQCLQPVYAGCKHFAWHLDYFPLKFNAWCLKTSIYTVWGVQTAQRNHSTYISRQLKRLFPYHDSKMALYVVHSLSFRKFRMSFFPSPKHTYFTQISASRVTACLISRDQKKKKKPTMLCLRDAKIFCGLSYIEHYACMNEENLITKLQRWGVLCTNQVFFKV